MKLRPASETGAGLTQVQLALGGSLVDVGVNVEDMRTQANEALASLVYRETLD